MQRDMSAEAPVVVVMNGDLTGQTLLEEALRVLDPAVTGFQLIFEDHDLSLENRVATANEVVRQATARMVETGYGLKAATTTEGPTGSPNALLRSGIDGSVIVRTGSPLPGVGTVADVDSPICVVRMATGDEYGASVTVTGEDEEQTATMVKSITRAQCRQVAEYAFQRAEVTGATVFGGPKWTVNPGYDGMLKEEMDAAARRHPDVPYNPQLIDATVAALLIPGQRPLGPIVIPALNRDGDLVSDQVMALYGTLAAAESLVIRLAPSPDGLLVPAVVMAEAPHGTAPALFTENRAECMANPLAMILASAALLEHMDDPQALRAAAAIRESAMDCIRHGIKTRDLGGKATMMEFTNAVIAGVYQRLTGEQTRTEKVVAAIERVSPGLGRRVYRLHAAIPVGHTDVRGKISGRHRQREGAEPGPPHRGHGGSSHRRNGV